MKTCYVCLCSTLTDLNHMLGHFIPKIQPISCRIRISSSAAFLLTSKESSKPRLSFLNQGESPRESPERESIRESVENRSVSLSRAVSPHEDQLLVVPRPNLTTVKRFLGLAGGLTKSRCPNVSPIHRSLSVSVKYVLECASVIIFP